MWARFITTDFAALLLFAVLYHVNGGDAQTVDSLADCKSERNKYFISLIAVSASAGFIIALISVGIAIKCYRSRKSRAKFPDPENISCITDKAELPSNPEQPVKHESYKPDKDRISNYELWTLARYAVQFKEKKELVNIGKLLNALGLQKSIYGSTEDLYELLLCWKKECRKRAMNEPDQVYKACNNAGMIEIARKLRDLRRVVSDVEGVTSIELEHILWQIATRSANHADNINRLLKALGTEKNELSNSSLKKLVEEALKILETWQEGFLPINPVVMLSLRWEDFGVGADEPEFYRVPQEEKQELPDTRVSKYANDATIRHCNRLFSVIKSCGRGKGVPINKTPYENEKVLFDTCKMIKDWMEKQECSNYEKRRRLKSAISSAKYPVLSDHEEKLFTLKTIKEKAYGDESNRVSVAYELLMTDVLPFARALGVDDSKLQEYRVQLIDSSHLKMGTIGLVTILVDK